MQFIEREFVFSRASIAWRSGTRERRGREDGRLAVELLEDQRILPTHPSTNTDDDHSPFCECAGKRSIDDDGTVDFRAGLGRGEGKILTGVSSSDCPAINSWFGQNVGYQRSHNQTVVAGQWMRCDDQRFPVFWSRGIERENRPSKDAPYLCEPVIEGTVVSGADESKWPGRSLRNPPPIRTSAARCAFLVSRPRTLRLDFGATEGRFTRGSLSTIRRAQPDLYTRTTNN